MPAEVVLSIQDALVTFGDKPLFEGLTFNIHRGDRIALVGRNGSGKSTIMNVITGRRDLDDGKRWRMPGCTIGYLQQDAAIRPGQTVRDYVFEEMKIEHQSEAFAYKVERVIHPLGIDIDARMDELSGGQIRRAALARALVEEPDVLLMDEPTNHLDLETIEWLEDYLKSYNGSLLCVSHDKIFLGNISDKVFWLDRGRLRVCGRGFSHFDDWSQMLLEQEEKELRTREKLLEQEIDWASRGVKARRKRNVRRLELMKEEREKLKRDKNSFTRLMSKIELDAPTIEESSKIVAEFIKVSKIFGEAPQQKVILDNFNLRILRGERIGILGKNGSGKSSFLKLLVGELQPDSGKVKIGREIDLSYFDQRRQMLNPADSLWKTLIPQGGDHINVMGKMRHVCGYLKDFQFDPQDALNRVSTLSGGQKNRLMLAKILANPGNLLILDEPTNDLDMDTLDMLEEILAVYTGTLIVVSHDRDFLDQTVTRVLAFEGDGKVEGHLGGYTDYQLAIAERDAPASAKAAPRKQAKPAAPPPPPSTTPDPVRLTYKLQYELDHLPARIATLEQDIAALIAQLSDASFYKQDPDGFNAASQKLVRAKEALDKAETRWLELEDMRGAGVPA